MTRQAKLGDAILVVDDNEDIRKQIRWGLSKEPYEILLASDADEALRLFSRKWPQVVALDLGLPPNEDGTEEGFRCLRKMLELAPRSKIVVITGKADRKWALQAIDAGAYDFYTKPLDVGELRVIINRALHVHSLESENRRRHKAAPSPDEQFGIVGDCPAMRQILQTIVKVACSDIPVFILGESGTGKELIARAVHAASTRAAGPLVAVNCGAIPGTLLESELFGHERGAFTGAHSLVRGKAEYADRGTLFLDEIAEIPPEMQVKLLRFLQEKSFQRVGGRKDIRVDIRFVSATNRDPLRCIEDGSFREDLYYRVNGVSIRLPPLRERGSDIELLAMHFLDRFGKAANRAGMRFSPGALECMRAYRWPGNVRELKNLIDRAVVMASGKVIEPEDLALDDRAPDQGEGLPSPPTGHTLREARELIEKDLVESTVRQCQGNITRAAKVLGVSRPTLYDLIRKHRLDA